MSRSKGYQNCVYVGETPHLKGMTAMVRPHDKHPEMVLVQFDDMKAERNGTMLAFNWHAFPKTSFKKRKRKPERGEKSWRQIKKSQMNLE